MPGSMRVAKTQAGEQNVMDSRKYRQSASTRAAYKMVGPKDVQIQTRFW